MEIRKGVISGIGYTSKYDDDGNEYRQYTLRIDGNSFTSKTPKDLYLTEGAKIVYEVDGTEILSGYCPAENKHWGNNVRALKKQVNETDKYAFTQGKIIEKRKETQRVNNTGSTVNEGLFRTEVTFTVVLENSRFRTSYAYGKNLKPNDEIAVVLDENWAVLLKDLNTGKYTGWNKPYFLIGLIVFAVALNLAIPYAQHNYPGLLVNPGATYLILNAVLALILIGNIRNYFGKQPIKKFMQQQLKG